MMVIMVMMAVVVLLFGFLGKCHFLHSDGIGELPDQLMYHAFVLRNLLSDSRAALTPAGKGDGLDLDGDALGQLLNSHAGASRLVSEVLLVDRVHLGEVVHGGDKDVDL